jgi:Tol biopolymer transport system component
MEYVAGETLKDRLKEGPLPFNEVLRIASEMAEALEVAHRKGIIHRDLKPSNILLTEQGHVKITDFGIAKRIRSEEGEDQEWTATLTQEASTLGTLPYMSPEQVQGQSLDHRSDIFSFGVILYEALSGVHPFRRETTAATTAAILKEDPPPLGASLEGNLDFQQLISKLLAKDVDDRYQSMYEVGADLKSVLMELRAVEVGDKIWLKSWPVAVVGTAVVILSFVIVWLYLESRPSETPSSTMTAVPLTSYPGEEVEPSLSPDGSRVAFSWNGEDQNNRDIYVQLVSGQGDPLRLTRDPKTDHSPVWSPDGQTIAFMREISQEKSEVRLIPFLGGTERKLTETFAFSKWDRVDPCLAWFPDGKWLVMTDKGSREEPYSLVLFSIELREKTRLTNPPVGSIGDGSPAVSPGGDRLVFTRTLGTAARELYLMPLSVDQPTVGEEKQITFSGGMRPAWMPDGREIVFCGHGGLWRMSADRPGSPQRVPYIGEGATFVSVSSYGSRLVYSREHGNSNIWRVPLARPGEAQGPPVRVISSTLPENTPSYSPDGKKIAFTSFRSGSPEIWVCDRDGSGLIQLTFFKGPLTGSPRWSPNSQQIAFDSRAEGDGNIYVVNAQGGKPRRLTFDPVDEATPSWSRDGKWIYFGSQGPIGPQVWKIPPEGGEAIQITRRGGWFPIESPDGKWIYFTRDEEKISLWRIPVMGGTEKQVLGPGPLNMDINFAVVDEGIYFIPPANPDQGHCIKFFNFTTHDIRRVITIGPAWYGLTVSPDGKSILYVQWEYGVRDLMLVEDFH